MYDSWQIAITLGRMGLSIASYIFEAAQTIWLTSHSIHYYVARSVINTYQFFALHFREVCTTNNDARSDSTEKL